MLLGAATFGFGYARTVAGGVALQAMMGFAGGADFAAGVKLIMAWFGRRDRGRRWPFHDRDFDGRGPDQCACSAADAGRQLDGYLPRRGEQYEN